VTVSFLDGVSDVNQVNPPHKDRIEYQISIFFNAGRLKVFCLVCSLFGNPEGFYCMGSLYDSYMSAIPDPFPLVPYHGDHQFFIPLHFIRDISGRQGYF
jgi:hypothetical protein